MTLEKLRVQCIKKNTTIAEVAKNIGISRQWLYNRIRKKDKATIKKIKKFLSNL